MRRSPDTAIDRLRSMPATGTFGFEFLDRDDAQAVVRMPPSEDTLQVERVVHGGAISGLADTAAVYLLLPALEEGQAMTSIEFKINFLRPVLTDRGPIDAEARIVKRGRTVAVASVEVRQSGALCALGVFTYLIMDAVPEPRVG